MTATLCSVAFLAQSMLGCGFGDGLFGHHRPTVIRVPVVREVVVEPAPVVSAGCCDVCGVEAAEVRYEVARLMGSPRWRQRDNGAHELREFDWRCHPEILGALSHALLTDCEEEVREEAAETLGKIDPPPCVPEVHAALARAAECDPDHATRKDARKALERIGRHCVAPCGICGPEVLAPPVGRDVLITPPVGVGPISGPAGAYPSVVEPAPPSYLESEPDFVPPADGGTPLPGPGLLPPGLPDPSVPPLPGDVEPFSAPPSARRAIDRRLTSRESVGRDENVRTVAARPSEEDEDDREVSRPRADGRRLLLLSIFGRWGR